MVRPFGGLSEALSSPAECIRSLSSAVLAKNTEAVKLILRDEKAKKLGSSFTFLYEIGVNPNLRVD